MISHSETPKPFECCYESCELSFACKHHLERHMKIIHTHEFAFACHDCDAIFPKK